VSAPCFFSIDAISFINMHTMYSFLLLETLVIADSNSFLCISTMERQRILKQLFKTYKNPSAIVVTTESIGPNWYSGKLIKSILERLNAFMSFSPQVYLETWQIILVRWPWPWYPWGSTQHLLRSQYIFFLFKNL